MPRKSAGLLLFRYTSVTPVSLEVLLAHPGGPYWARKDDGAWSIPKGEIADDEEPLAAAKREFAEEMGHPADGEFLALEPLKQPSGKLVLAWAVGCDFDPSTLESNTFLLEWPPKSGRQEQFPEVDRAAWFPIEAAKRKILKGQAPFLDQLLAKVPASKRDAHQQGDQVHPSESAAGREQRFVFDEVAELYARVRPTYPAALVDDVISESGLQPGGRILELGSGPGNASVLFSGRGYQLLCLEPGARLADVARRRLAGDRNARVVVTTFEAWPLEPEAFDLVFAAQSFHWMDSAVRFSKTARALKPDGTLAIFANRPLHGTGLTDDQIQRAYAAHAPAIDARWIGHNTRDHFLELFATAPEFRDAQWREYPWRAEYSSTEYLDLLRTHSDHRLLPAAQLSTLLDAIRDAIDANGGRFSIDYLAVLCWARRAPA